MFCAVPCCGSGQAGRTPCSDFINTTALFLGFGMSCVEHHAVAGLERSLQFDKNLLALDARDITEVNAAFLAKPGMDQFLVVDAAEPARVKPAGEGHLHFVFTIYDFGFTKR